MNKNINHKQLVLWCDEHCGVFARIKLNEEIVDFRITIEAIYVILANKVT